MIKACAFMSVFNDEDIILESVMKLIESGIDIYILDNGTTDNSIEKIKHLVGRGIIDIEYFLTIENGRHTFKLWDILKKFEEISNKLNYDWYLISDADEIKYSPWNSLCLREAIDKVDYLGYNLINFKLFNFRLSDNIVIFNDFETSLISYSSEDNQSSIQLKCWKKSDYVDLKKYGGHIVSRENPSVFPLRFINKHYPIRTIEQGKKKLFKERMDRYSPTELAMGWHSHYSDLNLDSLKGIVWDISELKTFDINFERNVIFEEALELLYESTIVQNFSPIKDLKNNFVSLIVSKNSIDVKKAEEIFDVSEQIYELGSKKLLPPIIANDIDKKCIEFALRFFSSRCYLSGDILASRNIKNIVIQGDK